MPGGLWTDEQADSLLQAGVITPAQHQQNQQLNGNVAALAGGPMASMPPPNMSQAPEPAIGPPPPPVQAPAAAPPAPAPSRLPPGVTESGGITILPKPVPEPQIDRADVDEIAAGGPPKMPRPQPPDVDQTRESLGLQPLTPRMRRDPEFRRRVDERDAEHVPVDREREAEREATERKVSAVVQQATDEYEARKAANAELEQRRIYDEQDRQIDLLRQQDYLDGINREADALAKTAVDNDRLYAHQTTRDKIEAFCFTLLGAAAAWTGQRGNSYLEAMNRLVDKDIETQKANLETRKGVLAQKRGIYSEMVKLYDNADAGRIASRARLKESIADRYDEIKARYAPDVDQANGDGLIARMREEAADERFKADEIVANQLRAERAAAAARGAHMAEKASDRRWELLKEQNKSAYDALKTAQTDGTPPPPWALRALDLVSQDAPKTDGKAGRAEGKEHREKVAEGKIGMSANEATIDRWMQLPIVKENTVGAGLVEGASKVPVTGGLAKRAMPGGAKDKAAIDGLNAGIMTMGGNAVKNAEGRVPPAVQEQLHKFFIEPGDAPQVKAHKLEEFRTWLRDRRAELGVIDPQSETKGQKAANDNDDPYAKYRVK